ncbi:FkbM family methyltransferase [Roseibium sp. SCPC15]|uniref:FkbM family methyltransferase n=1 Tax=Roseibium sp. SCP15 TaxID=3141376 RepID=UPI0033378905
MGAPKKYSRLLYSTGGICTAIGVSALETISENNVEYNDHLLLFSVDGNPKFQTRSEEQARALHNFDQVHHLEKFILDERLNTIDTKGLAANFSNTKIDEILVFAESSGTRFDALKKVFKGARITVYEEGMLGYCGKMFHNSKSGGLATSSRFISTNYFDKLFPQALKDLDVPVQKMHPDILRDKLNKSSQFNEALLSPSPKPTALLCTAPLWRFNRITIEQTTKAHVELANMLLEAGLTVYFKDHPRPTFKLFDSIRVQATEDYAQNLIDVTNYSSIAESIVDKLKPSITVGFGSTTLFNSYELYGVPSFRYKTELIPASLGYVEQHVVNAALKLRYIPSIKKISQVNAREETHDSYQSLAKEIFKQNLNQRQTSYEDEIIQRVAKRLSVQKWPKPETPAQVLDYIFLDDEMIIERNRKVRNLLTANKDIKETASKSLTKKLPLSVGKLLLNTLGDVTKLRLVTKQEHKVLQNENKNLKEANAALKSSLKVSEMELAELETAKKELDRSHKKKQANLETEITDIKLLKSHLNNEMNVLQGRLLEARQHAAKGLSPVKWRSFRSVPVMDKSWSAYVRNTSLHDALTAAMHMCRDMDELSLRTAKLVMQDAFLVSWDETIQQHLRYDSDFLEARSGIDFSKQHKLTKKKLEQITLGGSVNMGAVKQSLAYAHGLRELPVQISSKLKGRDFIDGGAYGGDSAFAFLDFDPRRIYCFEPALDSFEILKSNVTREGKQDLIAPIRSGLSDTSGNAQLTQNLRAGNYIIPDNEISDEINNDSIRLVAIDEFSVERQLDIGLIKLDVEGYERLVLNGATATIKKHRPFLLISVYHSAEDFLGIRDWIEGLQLNYRFQLRKFSPTPVMETVLIAIPDTDD